MLELKEFGKILKDSGFDFCSGVPCSFLKSLINYSSVEMEYYPATNEGDAVAIAAGANLAGRKSFVLFQNSGLSNAISPLTSLNTIFKIPVLGFVSLRGGSGTNDEPQHRLMGQVTEEMLRVSDCESLILSKNINEVVEQMKVAEKCLSEGRTFFFIVEKGTFSEYSKALILKEREDITCDFINKSKKVERPTRYECLQAISKTRNEKTVVIATTGKTGRELFQVEDSRQSLYMVGSMGCASSLGLGLSLAKKNIDTIVIDGDGALLMRLGALGTNAYFAPENMLHILLDNEVHDSTGGQSTISANVNFSEIARACKYPKVVTISEAGQLSEEIENWYKNKKLTFIHLKIKPGSVSPLGRPTVTPEQVCVRLKSFINCQ